MTMTSLDGWPLAVGPLWLVSLIRARKAHPHVGPMWVGAHVAVEAALTLRTARFGYTFSSVFSLVYGRFEFCTFCN